MLSLVCCTSISTLSTLCSNAFFIDEMLFSGANPAAPLCPVSTIFAFCFSVAISFPEYRTGDNANKK